MSFFSFLRNATTARLIDWKPTGEEMQWGSTTLRGYEAEIDGFKVKTILRSRRKEFCSTGIVIEKDGKSKTFTDDRKAIPGTKHEDCHITVYVISREMEEQDIVGSLRQSLARMLFS